MINWITEHPWMTFYLALAAIEAVSNIVASICTAVVSCVKRTPNTCLCSDCTHFEPGEALEQDGWVGYCKYGDFYTDPEDFCSRGKRKE